jgi:hypothetical protein
MIGKKNEIQSNLAGRQNFFDRRFWEMDWIGVFLFFGLFMPLSCPHWQRHEENKQCGIKILHPKILINMEKLKIITLKIVLVIIFFFVLCMIFVYIAGYTIATSIVERKISPQIEIYLDEPIDVNLVDSLLNENLLNPYYNKFKQFHPFKKNCLAVICFYEYPIERYSVSFSENLPCINGIDTIIRSSESKYLQEANQEKGEKLDTDSVWTSINGEDIGFFEKRRIKKRLEEAIERAIEEHQKLRKK